MKESDISHVVLHMRVDGWSMVYPTGSMIYGAAQHDDQRPFATTAVRMAEVAAEEIQRGIAAGDFERGFFIATKQLDELMVYPACLGHLRAAVVGAAPFTAEVFEAGDRCCGWLAPDAQRVIVERRELSERVSEAGNVDPTTIKLENGANVVPFAPNSDGNGGWDA